MIHIVQAPQFLKVYNKWQPIWLKHFDSDVLTIKRNYRIDFFV